MGIDLDKPAAMVAGLTGIEPPLVIAPGKECKREAAIRLLRFRAVRELGSSAIELSGRMGISPSGIRLPVQRGERPIKECGYLLPEELKL